MFFIRRTWVLCFCVLWAGPVCAFSFSYGNLLVVKDVENQNGSLLLPVSQRKYHNVRVLSKKLYDFLGQCKTDCRYEEANQQFEIAEYRLPVSQKNMLIAQVDIQRELRLTFLVFKNKNGFFVKAPEEVIFKDKKWAEKINHQVRQLAEKKL